MQYINQAIIDLLLKEEDKRNLQKKLAEISEPDEQERIKKRELAIFGQELSPEDLSNLHEIFGYGFRSAILVYSMKKRINEIGMTAVLFSDKDNTMNYEGVIHLSFYNRGLFVRYRDIRKQKLGIGLEIECKLEKFCRNNDIWEINNIAASNPTKGEIGAYVWARYGYEFDRPAEAFNLTIVELTGYLFKRDIEPEKRLYSSNRPIDLALLKGRDKEGRIVNVGKEFLINSNIEWHGKRDLSLDSQGTRDFLEYLRERGREDLIAKYF